MNIRLIVFCATLTFSSISICHDVDMVSSIAPGDITREVRLQPMIQSFINLIKMFVAIITNDQVQRSIKTINELVAIIIQTALSIKEICAPSAATPEQMAHAITDQESVKRTLLAGILHHTSALRFDPVTRANQSPLQHVSPKQDETTQKVITHFGLIVQSFFNIVKDPENSENVTPNLINMLSNIVTIGAEVMKRNAFSSVTARHEIILFVTSGIDERLKQDLLATLYLTLYRNGVIAAA